MIQTEWNHPTLGRISEVACPEHVRQLLAALHFLGIGATSTNAPTGQPCLRCSHTGGPRGFLRAATTAWGAAR